MINKTTLSLLLIISIAFHFSSQAPTYLISCPKLLERWTANKLVVSFYDITANTTVTLKLDNGNGKSLTLSQIFNPKIGSDLSYDFSFDSSWPNGQITGTLASVGGLAFTQNFVSQIIDSKSVVVFQLSSLVYNPGDLVLLRIIILDQKFRPIQDKTLTNSMITILDPKGSKRAILHQDQNGDPYKFTFNITKGVTNDILFKIDHEDLTGTWTIEMALNNVVENYKFEVRQTAKSMVDMVLTAPRFNKFTESIIPLKINTEYKFGQTVNGIANIDISKVMDCQKTIPSENITHFNKQITKFSKYNEISLDFNDLKFFNPKCDGVYQLKVDLVDNITKQQYSQSINLNFLQNNIKVRFVNKNEKIKPGIKFRAILEFSYLGNEKQFDFQDLGDKIQYIHLKNSKVATIPFSIINNNNRIFFDYLTEPDTASITLTVNLSGNPIASQVYPAIKCIKTMLSVIFQEPLKQLKVGDITSLIISSNEPINMLKYYFVVEDKIMNASTIIYPVPALLVNFQLVITKNIVPRSKFVAYFYSRATGSIAEDYVDISTSDFSENFIHISAKNVQDDKINLTQMSIESQPNSMILVHAFNEENLNQNRNSNLIESQLRQKWDEINDDYDKDDPIANKLTTLSNAVTFCAQPYEMVIEEEQISGPFYEEIFNEQVRRKDTWIWDKYSINNEGAMNLTTYLPPSESEWQISALALNPERGIGIVKQQFEIKVPETFVLRPVNLGNLIEDTETNMTLIVYNPLSEKIKISVEISEDFAGLNKLLINNCRYSLEISGKEIKTLTCSIVAIRYGMAKINFLSRNSLTNTTLTKYQENIRVEPKGAPKTEFRHRIIDLELNSEPLKFNYTWDFPKMLKNNTQRLFIMVNLESTDEKWYSKVLSNTNLQPFKLDITDVTCNIKMFRLFSHISRMKYLYATKQLNGAEADQVVQEIKLACYKTPYDGSIVDQTFAGKASTDPNLKTSTWMTAQWLKSMKGFTIIRNNYQDNIYMTASYLKRQELFTGEELESDPILIRRPNSLNFRVYLTAFVFIALSSDDKSIEPESEMIGYIAQQYNNLESNYDRIISCYAFILAGHELKTQCFNDILAKIMTDPDKGFKFCPNNDGNPDIESTSYCLLIMIKNNYYSFGIEFYNYLLSFEGKGNTTGDEFQTALAFDAMSELIQVAQVHRDNKNQISVIINGKIEMKLNADGMLIKVSELPINTNISNIEVKGYGTANLYFVVKYNSLDEESDLNKTTITMCKSAANENHTLINVIDLPKGTEFVKENVLAGENTKIEISPDKKHIYAFVPKDTKCFGVHVNVLPDYPIPQPIPIKFYAVNEVSKYKLE